MYHAWVHPSVIGACVMAAVWDCWFLKCIRGSTAIVNASFWENPRFPVGQLWLIYFFWWWNGGDFQCVCTLGRVRWVCCKAFVKLDGQGPWDLIQLWKLLHTCCNFLLLEGRIRCKAVTRCPSRQFHDQNYVALEPLYFSPSPCPNLASIVGSEHTGFDGFPMLRMSKP